MNTKILTTHVGSLPRSKALSELLFAKDKGDSFSENEFDDVVKQNVSDIVKKQLDIGIDFVSDGEMSKIRIFQDRTANGLMLILFSTFTKFPIFLNPKSL